MRNVDNEELEELMAGIRRDIRAKVSEAGGESLMLVTNMKDDLAEMDELLAKTEPCTATIDTFKPEKAAEVKKLKREYEKTKLILEILAETLEAVQEALFDATEAD